MGKFLIVGADGFVGSALMKALAVKGHEVYGTTRRADTTGGRRLFLDIEDYDSLVIPPGVDYAYITAAISNYEQCESDGRAYDFNVRVLPRLVEKLVGAGVFVTFISSNTVFGGETPWPEEDAEHVPNFSYARQKADGERALRELLSDAGRGEDFNVVRLTKVLGRDTSPLPGWRAAWRKGEAVEPFSDLIFSPVSRAYVAHSLLTIGELRIAGNFHLSGADNVSYVDLAKAMAEKGGVDERLIVPTTSTEKGVRLAFSPTYSGLSMARTTRLTGLAPQTLHSVVDDLYREMAAGAEVVF
ncbi:hypothetical protein JCM17961_00410 [Endothiovibrio diazotrophicus]